MVYGVILLSLIFVVSAIGAGSKPGNPEYLSKDTGLHLRGICCLMVVVNHHFVDFKGLSWFYANQSGACAVAMFFFLSGYGLIRSMKPEYMQGFLKRKIIRLWTPVIILSVISYVIYNYLIPYETDAYRGFHNLFRSLLHGDTLIHGFWYVIALTWFYIAFCGAYHYTYGRGRKDRRLFLSIIIIAYLIYLVRIFAEGSGFIWVYTPHMFIAGLIWSFYEERLIKDNRILGVLATVSILGIVVSGIIESRSKGLRVLGTIMLAMSFVFLMLFILRNVQIGNRFTAFIGKRSFGIYLSHQLTIYILDRYIEDVLVWLIVSIPMSIVIGCIWDLVFSEINKRVTRSNKTVISTR